MTAMAKDSPRTAKTAQAERERIATAIEAQIRHLRAVPRDVTTVPRDLMALDLQNLADGVRGGRYAATRPGALHEHDAAGCLDCECWATPMSSRTPCTCPPGVRSDMRTRPGGAAS